MKKLLIIASVAFCGASLAEVTPQCRGHYWTSPNFQLITGGEVCDGRVAACNFKGTCSEGWVSYDKTTERKIAWSNCRDADESSKPRCLGKGHIGSGWYSNGVLIASGECLANEEVVCAYEGTRSEGWYTYDQSTRDYIVNRECSQI